MKKIVIISLLFVSLSSLYAAEKKPDDLIELQKPFGKEEADDGIELRDPEKAEERIVPNASYVKYSVDWLFRGVRVFYDADGNKLFKTRDLSRTIDPNAPKPKVATVRFTYMDEDPMLHFYGRNRNLIGTRFVKEEIKYVVSEDDLSAFDFSELSSKLRRTFFRKIVIRNGECDGNRSNV